MTRSTRQEFPAKVRKAAFLRAAGKCEGCGHKLRPARYQYDHVKADGLGGAPVLENCKVLCSGSATSCHALKTAEDQKIMVKADAIKNTYHGTSKIKTRINRPPKAEKPIGKPRLAPRVLFVDIKQ